MPKRKEKLKGVTFQLVHRSQQDPLVADETAPQRVLLPVPNKESKTEKEKRIEKQHEYGIYFDDDYNYLQSIKDVSDNRVEWPQHVDEELKKREEKKRVRIQLPSSVFPSDVEEKVGMLNKATPVSGPQLHLDPDLVAAMDEDFDYDDPENQLEDDFVAMANGAVSDEEFNEEDEDDYDSDFNDEEMDEVGSELSFSKEETKSRFTNYSMSSSVIRRNEQLQLLDGRFEKMYETYNDTEIGPLDSEEIEGHIPESSELLLRLADEFEEERKKEQIENNGGIKGKIEEQLERMETAKEVFVPMVVEEKDKWDCETILSTYSNIYNRPKLIEEPRKLSKISIDKRTGIPKNTLGTEKLTVKALNELNERQNLGNKGPKSVGGQSIISQLSVLSMRDKNESLEEKRERKQALKEYRRERRKERKMNAEAFKEENKRQVKIAINNRNNVQGNRLL